VKNNIEQVLGTPMHGGTNFDCSTSQFLTYLEANNFPVEKSDLLLITDGYCTFGKEVANKVVERFSRIFVILAPGGDVQGFKEIGKQIPVRVVTINHLVDPTNAKEVFKEIIW
jgi:uncharacterized protein with von Willebrand factor type A (vWA) domain